jgi:hypothetical protein
MVRAIEKIGVNRDMFARLKTAHANRWSLID